MSWEPELCAVVTSGSWQPQAWGGLSMLLQFLAWSSSPIQRSKGTETYREPEGSAVGMTLPTKPPCSEPSPSRPAP